MRDHGDGTKTVSFMPSPRMSTYLLAFVVGEFDFVSALTKNGVTIRVFCPPGKPQLGRFALECAVNALDAYDDTFQIVPAAEVGHGGDPGVRNGRDGELGARDVP